jgi:tetratricopeptide (TPR) repeat protein
LDPPQRLEAVKQLLAQYRMLLAWDNFESVREMPDPAGATPPLDEAASAALKGFLEWVRDHSSSAVLVTSRAQETWLGQIRRIGVGGLNRTEAAQYAGHLLEPYPAAQRRRERRSFGDLLVWLDGHPLALRLTLPGLEISDPADLLAALRGTTPLAAADAPDVGRTTSLAASITYSYEHLTDQTRRLLPAVSLFHSIADEDVLMLFSAEEAVSGRFARISREEWAAVLGDAARVGLLTGIGAGMHQVHPALPGYLAAGWRAEDPGGYDQERRACEQALCTASAAFSRWLTGQIESGNAGLAYTLLGLQRRTLGAMLGHALDHREWPAAGAIVRALDAYWDTRGLSAEATVWADRILDATADPGQTPPEPSQSLWVYTTVRQASRQMDAGQPDRAAQAYRRALAYLQDQPATEWTRASIAVIYHQLGMTAQVRGRLDEAEEWYRKSLAIEEELGNPPGMALTYGQLGNTAQDRGRLDEAEEWYRKSLAISKELGNRPVMAIAYHQLGITAQDRGRLDEAEDWYRRAILIREELGLRVLLATDYHQLGMTAQDRGRLDEAEDWYRRAILIREELGLRVLLATDYHQLGNTAYLRGRLDEADDWYRKSLAISEELGDRPSIASTYHQLGMAAQARGWLDEAEDWYRKSLAIKEELGNRPGMALTYAQFGRLAEDRAQAPLALAWNIRCVTLLDEFPSPLTRTGPSALVRLARQLGMAALEETWVQVTGQPLPQPVRDYITSHRDEQPAGEP